MEIKQYISKYNMAQRRTFKIYLKYFELNDDENTTYENVWM